MALDLLLLLLGIGALYFGAEWLVRGGVRLGTSFGISRVVIGLTIVSLGTSAPELIVCTVAALRGNGDLAMGNVIGSNLANIGLIMGITALITPLFVAERIVRREIPVMLVVTVIAYPMLMDGTVTRGNGAVLLAVLAGYLGYLFWIAKRANGAGVIPMAEEGAGKTGAGTGAGAGTGTGTGAAGGARAAGAASSAGSPGADPDDPSCVVGSGAGGGAAPGSAGGGGTSMLPSIALIVVGAFGLLAGGHLIVGAATAIAEALDLSELFIGLTIVAIGTSLPELATSVVAAFRQEADVAVGNIIGSNVFNLTAVLGIASLATPVPVAPDIIAGEYPAMFLLSLLILPVALPNYRIQRPGGTFLIVMYGGILWFFM